MVATSNPPSPRAGRAATAAAAIALTVHAATYLPFVSDDALISLRYAARFAAGRGLTWADHERVEGYTNLAWVLLNAALAAVGVEGVLGARVLGVALSIACVVAVAHGASGRASAARALSGGLFLALSPPIAAWAIGGLEQPLVAACLAIAFVLLRRLEQRPRAALELGAALAVLVLARADAPLLVVPFVVAVAMGTPRRAAVVRAALVGGVPAAAVLAQTAFRLAYYGDWLPNTAYAKVAFHPARLAQGVAYVERAASPLLPVVVVIVTLSLVARRADRLLLAYGLVAVVWAAHIARVGGDIFPAFRQSVPVVVALAFALADACEELVSRSLIALVAVTVTASAGLQVHDPESRRAAHEGWEWDGKILGRLLRRAYLGTSVVVASDPAGCVPFWSELEAIDLLGLNDRWLAHHRPPGFGAGALGHELADGAYTFARRPDLLVLCGPLGAERPCYPNGEQLFAQPGFDRLYRPFVVRTSEEDGGVRDAHLWARVDSSTLGFASRGATLHVPAPFLVLDAPPRGARREGDRWVLDVDAPAIATLRRLPLAPGAYVIAARAARGPLVTRVRCGGDVVASPPGEPLLIAFVEPVVVDIRVGCAGGCKGSLEGLDVMPAAVDAQPLPCPGRPRD